MSVMTISGGAGTSAAAATKAASGTAAASSTKSASGPAATKHHGHHKHGISKDAEAMKQLKDLETSDPEKLKAAAAEISDKLKAAAQTQGGDAGKALSALADKFATVAKTGDMSALRPAERSGGAQGTAPATGAEAYSQNAQRAAATTDVSKIIADSIKDVSKATP